MPTPDQDLLVVELFQVAVDCRQLPLVESLEVLPDVPDPVELEEVPSPVVPVAGGPEPAAALVPAGPLPVEDVDPAVEPVEEDEPEAGDVPGLADAKGALELSVVSPLLAGALGAAFPWGRVCVRARSPRADLLPRSVAAGGRWCAPAGAATGSVAEVETAEARWGVAVARTRWAAI